MKKRDILSEQELMNVFGGEDKPKEQDPNEVTSDPVPDEPA